MTAASHHPPAVGPPNADEPEKNLEPIPASSAIATCPFYNSLSKASKPRIALVRLPKSLDISGISLDSNGLFVVDGVQYRLNKGSTPQPDISLLVPSTKDKEKFCPRALDEYWSVERVMEAPMQADQGSIQRFRQEAQGGQRQPACITASLEGRRKAGIKSKAPGEQAAQSVSPLATAQVSPPASSSPVPVEAKRKKSKK